MWTSVLLLLVAAGSAAAGIAAGRDTKAASGPATIVATSPVVAAPPAPPAATTTTAKPAVPKPRPTPKPAPPTDLAVWPARNGYTVVLASIPVRGTGLADAKAKATEAQSRGVRPAGVLESSRFASLHPGYYVVFAGIYGSLEEAQIAARRISSRFPNGYAREITR